MLDRCCTKPTPMLFCPDISSAKNSLPHDSNAESDVPVVDGLATPQPALVQKHRGNPSDTAGRKGFLGYQLASGTDTQGRLMGAGVSTGRAFPAPHVGPEPQLTWHRKGPQGTKPKVLRRKSSQHKSVLNQVLEELDKVEHDLSHDTGETVAFQKRGDQVVPIYDEGTWTMKSRGMPELPNPGEARQAGINGLLDKIPGYINHNPTKVKAPAYTCRGAKAPAEGGCSPGPRYYVEPSMTRTGKYVASAYAITGLLRIKTEIIPGPSDYSAEKSNRHVFKCLPEQSMGFRNRGVKTNLSPGPSTYTLPRVLGPNTAHTSASPCHSMKSRSQRDRYDADLAKTPGPAALPKIELDFFKTRAPGYTIGTRSQLQDKTVKPGPADYRTGRVVLIKPQAPAATFELRHSVYTTPLILDI
ncbi:hypothetical protein Q9233_015682 [Columba guinea]|nr:hypothetical protein Q9233_015682 [Columba guinea]